jgi:hypothetical protein
MGWESSGVDGATGVAVTDARRATAYLVAHESDEYIAVMQVLEASITDLTPAEVVRVLAEQGIALDERTVEARLDQLRDWTAASARTDTSRILRHADLLARNWRWTATPAGRQVQRFYATVLAGTPTMREIPLSSLERVVRALRRLVEEAERLDTADIVDLVGQLFTSHDDLDSALVGSEDSLTVLADRFDLDNEDTAELKQLLVEYATRVAAELETGAARAHRDLLQLRPQFERLAATVVTASDASALISRGALSASRGGRPEDWSGLLAWCDPATGRAARFALRLVRALPGMHANLRRLHASAAAGTGRARALLLARACAHPLHGPAIFLAATGDHSWRKLYADPDDADLARIPSWWDGPTVAVPELLRATGRAGARGRPPAARDDAAARAEVAARRRERDRAHADAVHEVLAASPGDRLSDRAARTALHTLLATARSAPRGRRRDTRSAARDGLACTIFHVPGARAVLRAPTWHVLLPDRLVAFHHPGARVARPSVTVPDDETYIPLRVVGGGAA